MDHPPKLAIRFLCFFLKKDLQEEVLGDLEEQYLSQLKKHSPNRAVLNYWLQAINYLRPFAIKKFKSPQMNPVMLSHNIKISYRTLLKNKTFSLINIGGLAIGITVSIFIGLWVMNEYSFNKNHEHYDRIVQVFRKDVSTDAIYINSSMTGGLGGEIDEKFPHYFEYTALTFFRPNEQILTVDENSFEEMGYFFQPDITHILSLPMLEGTRDALQNPSNVIISKSFAEKAFGNGMAIGQTINLNANVDLIVGGVFDDFPMNSTFGDASFFSSMALIYNEQNPYVWDNYNMKLFALLQPNVTVEDASSAIRDVMAPYREEGDNPREMFLLPMKDWNLNSTFENGVQVVSRKVQFIRLFIVIGLFILLIGCINFMNLNTAQYQTRGKEVGIRKTLGSVRVGVASQFLVESFMYVFGALIVSLVLVYVLLPGFNQISGKEVVFPWEYSGFWLSCLAFSFSISLFAGSYPAFFLSSFNPIEAIKGKLRQGRKSVRFRQVLVVSQFTISIFLIIGTITIHEQINHAKTRSMGYEKEGLITIEGRNSEFAEKAELLREELIRTGAVEEVAFSNYPLTNTLGNNGGFSVDGSSTIVQETFNTIYVTPEYGAATQWELVAGREFSRDLGNELNSIILSESAVAQLGLTDPIGKEIISHNNSFNDQTNFTVVGVVKDMIKGSPFGVPIPLMLFANTSTNRRGYMFVRLNPEMPYGESVAAVQKSFHSVLPGHPFHAHFADDQYLAKFRSEDQTGTLATIFSTLAILISCLGLFGLSAFMVTQRVKEIGIRKVLGASVASLWALLSKDFGILVGIACLISVPIGGYIMNIWLQDYAYRISLGWEIYAVSILLSMLITLATVSYHSLKASTVNPVQSLKVE